MSNSFTKLLGIVSIISAVACDGRDLTSPTPPPAAKPPAMISASSSPLQDGIVRSNAWEPPVVAVWDKDHRPVRGASVSCAVASGGGKIERATVLTNSSGRAACGAWMLGDAGENRLDVAVETPGSVTTTAVVTFYATVRDSTYYEMYDLRTINGEAVPIPGHQMGGKFLLAPDSTFIVVYFLSGGDVFVARGRYSRTGNFLDLAAPLPYGSGSIEGDILTVSYFDFESGTEVYQKVN
jgi:hypothetical protein